MLSKSLKRKCWKIKRTISIASDHFHRPTRTIESIFCLIFVLILQNVVQFCVLSYGASLFVSVNISREAFLGFHFRNRTSTVDCLCKPFDDNIRNHVAEQ